MKRDTLGNPIGEEHKNPILDTRAQKLELPDGRDDAYVVNIIIENLIDQIDDQVWDSGVLEEIVSFFRDPDVAIPTGEQ